MTRSGRKDVLLGAGVIAFALSGYLLVIPAGVDSPASVPFLALAPAFWPNIIMGLLSLLGLLLIMQGLRSKSVVEAGDSPVGDAGDTAEQQVAGWRPTLVAIALLFAYYLALQSLGFVAASMLALLCFLPLAGVRRIGLIAVITIVLPVALYYFFTLVAKVAVPLGIFETVFSG